MYISVKHKGKREVNENTPLKSLESKLLKLRLQFYQLRCFLHLTYFSEHFKVNALL